MLPLRNGSMRPGHSCWILSSFNKQNTCALFTLGRQPRSPRCVATSQIEKHRPGAAWANPKGSDIFPLQRKLRVYICYLFPKEKQFISSRERPRVQCGALTSATHKPASVHHKPSYLKSGQLCGCGMLSQKLCFLQGRRERTQSNSKGKEQQVERLPCRSPPLITAMMTWVMHFCFWAFCLLEGRTPNDKIPPLLKQSWCLRAAKQPVRTGVSSFSGEGRGKCQGHSGCCSFLPACLCLCLKWVYRLLMLRARGKLQIQHNTCAWSCDMCKPQLWTCKTACKTQWCLSVHLAVLEQRCPHGPLCMALPPDTRT